MLPELVPSGAFFKWWPWVDLDNFMTGSNLFPVLLYWYGWQLIQYWMLMYFQICSNSAYPQHSGERYRTNGPLVNIPASDIFIGGISGTECSENSILSNSPSITVLSLSWLSLRDETGVKVDGNYILMMFALSTFSVWYVLVRRSLIGPMSRASRLEFLQKREKFFYWKFRLICLRCGRDILVRTLYAKYMFQIAVICLLDFRFDQVPQI